MNQHKIKIKIGKIEIQGNMNGCETSIKLLDLLPIIAKVNTWGHEIYFPVGLGKEVEPNSSDIVESGSLAYWPPGDAFCIFYGKTPASTSTEIRAASPVTLLGNVLGDETVFKAVSSGEEITLERSS